MSFSESRHFSSSVHEFKMFLR